ncbi:unnamed protein product [Trichogramma brassicae]|uniref:Uncharacterized protein n=1 Tax=Trichogramma brassicae TaxID=86971 RepID=A0A6H5J7B8_9HYME|nr:unnamed protein product [Trichogramma brassicae]
MIADTYRRSCLPIARKACPETERNGPAQHEDAAEAELMPPTDVSMRACYQDQSKRPSAGTQLWQMRSTRTVWVKTYETQPPSCLASEAEE